MVMHIQDSRELRTNWARNEPGGELAFLLLELFEQKNGVVINVDACEALCVRLPEFRKGIDSLRKYLKQNTDGWLIPKHPDQVAPRIFRYRLTRSVSDKLDNAHKLQFLGSNKLAKAVDIILSLEGQAFSDKEAAQIRATQPAVIALGALAESRRQLERAGVDLERIQRALTPPNELERALAVPEDESPRTRMMRLEGAAHRQIAVVLGPKAGAA